MACDPEELEFLRTIRLQALRVAEEVSFHAAYFEQAAEALRSRFDEAGALGELVEGEGSLAPALKRIETGAAKLSEKAGALRLELLAAQARQIRKGA